MNTSKFLPDPRRPSVLVCVQGSYAKLRDGSWGLRSEVTLREMDAVVATRKNGQARVVWVTDIVWTGKEGGKNITLARFTDVPPPVASDPNMVGEDDRYTDLDDRDPPSEPYEVAHGPCEWSF